MRVNYRLRLMVVVLLLVASTVLAYGQASSFHVLVEQQASGYRFTVQEESITSIRVEVLSLNGNQLFDSDWVNNKSVIWPLTTRKEKLAADGVYLYAVSVRDREGREQRKLGKLAIVQGMESWLSVPPVGQLAGVQPLTIPPGVIWRQRLALDLQDNFRIQRRPGPSPATFQTLLQLEADGKLRISELCLGAVNGAGGDCRSSWPGPGGGGATPSGWTDDGTIVRLSTPADKVGIGTTSPASKLTVAGSETTTHGADAAVQITNTATGGANWYLRVGATGTGTPAGGLSIANDQFYWLFIANTGNVGIGKNAFNPGSQLTVKGMIESTSGGIKFPDGTIQTTAAGGGGGAPSGWVDAGTIVRLATATDKVGIGTTNPSEILTVAGNISTTGTIDSTGQKSKIRFHYDTLADLPSASTYHGMFAHVHATGKAYFAHAGNWVALANEIHTHSLADIANQDCGAGMAIRGWSGGTLNCLSVGVGASSGWADDGTVVRLATTTDNVGIGTTNPGSKLTVAGMIETTSGGIKFPDGTTQTTAATGGGGSGWTLTGNAIAASQFLGTTNNQAFELKVNNQRTLRIEPASTPNLIGGFNGNFAGAGVVGATISGGGANGTNNRVTDSYGTIGGGVNNQAGDSAGSVDDKSLATVGGGAGNQATGNSSTVGGGLGNAASGDFATIPGGMSNTAVGNFSLAAGRRAKANNQGSFVWADNSVDADFSSTADNQFLIRASKVGIGTTSPEEQLHVKGNIALPRGNKVIFGDLGTGTGEWIQNASTGFGLSFFGLGFERMRITNTGNVGIGTTNPGATLTVHGPDTSGGTFALRIEDSTGALLFGVDDIGRAGTKGGFTVGAFAGPTSEHVCRTTAPAAGILATCFSAGEYVPTIDTGLGYPEPADLVSIQPKVKNPYGDDHGPFVVARSNKPCDDDLLGFILRPELGADGKKLNEHYLGLGIYGYFSAKVTMENGSIERGDPITSSSKPGYGMKATQACKIIGYALEDANKEGTIQVFAHLSEYAVPEVTALRAQVQALERSKTSEMEELRQRIATLEKLVEALSKR